MRLRLRWILLTISLLFNVFSSPAHAVSVDPFPPFSIEGNPDQDYYFSELFPLFRYFRPRALEIYENLDRSRTYVDLMVCPGADADRRDQYCNNQGDGCDGGEVDLCHNDPENKSFSHTVTSKSGSCKLNRRRIENPDELVEGKCEYTKRPSVITKVKGTDFSVKEDLTFPKIQGESNAYNYIGSDNEITWGSMYLNSDPCEIAIRKVLVVRRAKQTKNTLRETGEWPLGWVDWGYKDSNMTKTLLEINDELPDSIASQLNSLVESIDDFYVTAGSLVSDISAEKKIICDAVNKARALPTPPEWLKDLDSAPMYAPSYRQGYVRPSICIWDKCCPTTRCPLLIEELLGNKRGLYYDLSVSQAYNAALDNLFISYPLDQAMKIFTQVITNNPLVRYLSSAAPEAIPSRVRAELNIQLKDTCLKYIPWSNWLSFGTHMDYLDSGNFLGPNKTCPDYELMPELSKETALATSTSVLDAVINLIWGRKVDDVEPDKYHLLTIPDAMGQSLQEIQQATYNTRDTLTDLEAIKDYNLGLSNIVDDSAQFLYSGKALGPADSKRRLGIYTCDDDMFSSGKDTSIEAYALGTRIGCNETSEVPVGKCDGQLFEQLLTSGKFQDVSAKAESYFNTNIKGNLTPELMNTYAAAEKATGVPCEILAGIHFVEADNNPQGSLVSGRKLGTPEPDAGGKVFKSLLDTAIYAGEHLKGKVGGNIKDSATAITALSRYNGGGNSNCQLGYPYSIPYAGCPRAFEGEDDPYPTNFIDAKHATMYLLYCADHTACVPQVFERPGSFTVALAVYNQITKNGYENSQLPPKQERPSGPTQTTTSGTPGSAGFFPKSCGPQTLSTALGCIPYTTSAFVSSLLTFLVGIAGAIALVTMLIATFQIMTAGGNPQQLQKGKELFSSAVIGLLFLIFSVTLLRLIAGDIIKLPGF